MSITIPKVFISYSWEVADKVYELAERLVNPGGVDVVLDKWDLKEGHDKYAFMEQAVTNPEITHVLIICDKTYAEKANSRKGGVGNETIIMSPEVYGEAVQEKFIPVIFETDENGKPFLPAYIKSRIYIDLSSEEKYEAEYEKLLRNLHGKPEHRKPKLSAPPEWLNEENVSLSAVRDLIKQIKGYNGGNSSKASFLIRKANDEFFQALKSFGLPLDKSVDGDLLLKRIDATKPLRDYFLDYIEALISKDMPVGEIASDYFENLHNSIIDSINLQSYYPDNLELYYYFIWESFICTVAILLHYEKYEEINKMLTRTYFLNDHSSGEISSGFAEFRRHFKIIEGMCKPKLEEPRPIALAGEIAVKRERKPIITQESISNADLILYQMSCALETAPCKWFPILHIYRFRHGRQTIWTRLKSKKHCVKMFPLFGVNTLSELKQLIGKCEYDSKYKYNNNPLTAAPNILSSIKLEEVGTLY